MSQPADTPFTLTIKAVQDEVIFAVLRVLEEARVMKRVPEGEYMMFEGPLAYEVFDHQLDLALGRA